jgi:hypothetical protein
VNAVAGPDPKLDALVGATDTDKCQGLTPAGDEVMIVTVLRGVLPRGLKIPAGQTRFQPRTQCNPHFNRIVTLRSGRLGFSRINRDFNIENKPRQSIGL